jgi:23S rRNA (uracil1939-C5)-methyltransferase
MKKHQILENIYIEKLIFGGSGLATAPDGRRIIITGGAIPDAIVNLRILKIKKSHIEAQIIETIKKSSLEKPIPEQWQLYGGCKWLSIPYIDQLRIKEEQIREAFHSLFPILSLWKDTPDIPVFHSIITSPETEWYRNKVEFSWGKYISAREWVHEEYRFWFHLAGQFDRIENCRFCVLADEEVNSIFRFVDHFARSSGISTYDPKIGIGFWRHFVVRKAKKTGQAMLIFSVNTSADKSLSEHDMREFVKNIHKEFPSVRSSILLKNTWRADIVQGEEVILFGDGIIEEVLLGMKFEIQPRSFFQVNTLWAEKLYTRVIDSIEFKWWTLLDLYAGTWTIGILLAGYFSRVYSVELVKSSSEDGIKNAEKNNVNNVEFINAKVEDFAEKFASEWGRADTIILDPPRDGLYPGAIPHILSFWAKEIIYVSCNPATLVRDLEWLTHGETVYRITDVTPMDMFPHTHHIETVVRLEKV